MAWQRLKTPPIKEAVLDIRFEQIPSDALAKLNDLSRSLQKDYPINNEIFFFNMGARIQQGQNPKVDSKKTLSGYKLTNKDRSFILQLRTDGIALSKVEPYLSWEELSEEAGKALIQLKALFPELQFKRLALRYINQFNLAFDEPINSYMNILPNYPTNLPQTVDGFTVRLLVPKKEDDLKSIILAQIESTLNSDRLFRVTFDIDVYKESKYHINEMNKVFSEFAKIREFKNEIFFNGLTPKTLNIFN